MWDSKKSVVLSCICTRLMIGVVIVFAFFAPRLIDCYIFYTSKPMEITTPLLITVYGCCMIAVILLLCLNHLLDNIKVNEVFIEKNVTLLRIISWCCFVVAAILIVSGFYYILFILVGIVAAFFGLILRVFKNVIAQAVQIKNENDFTI